MDKRTVIYYSDELNDEFSVAQITPRRIDKEYVYCHDSLWKKWTHFFWYRLIATPLAFLYTKIIFHHTAVGTKAFRKYKKTGYFLYGNHTQDIGDALIPHMLNFPKNDYTIVHPNNVSMPYLGKVTPALGALPLPDDLGAHRNFTKAIDRRIGEGHAIVIYPEAHIWPFYTKIRPFGDVSFSYPVRLGAPVFCFTNTYQKRRFSGKPKNVTYIDGPFFPDSTLSPKEQRADLRNKVYDCMCRRAENSTVVKITYVKREKTNDEHSVLR